MADPVMFSDREHGETVSAHSLSLVEARMNPQLDVPVIQQTPAHAAQGGDEHAAGALRTTRSGQSPAMPGAVPMFPSLARVELPSMWQRPPDAMLSGQAVVGVFARPAWLMDDRRNIYRANVAATAALASGNWVRESDGLLRCIDPASDQRMGAALAELVAARFDGAGGSRPAWQWLCLDNPARGVALPGTISLLTPEARRASEMLILFTLHDPDQGNQVDPAILDRLFGLTRAEARVANSLVQGLSPKDIAAASGVALGTVRTQLKSVFAKTRSRRQAELVRLLITLCPG
jgi:DNA-binding CsgD family transcriptional regulator